VRAIADVGDPPMISSASVAATCRSGGSYINIRRDDPDGPERLAQYDADLRQVRR